MLLASGATLRAAIPSDACEVIVDSRAELTVTLIDVKSEPADEGDVVERALKVVREAARDHAPMYEIVAALRTFTAGEHDASVAIALLRFSQPDARVEILNAGMPAIARVLPDGSITLHASLSTPIGRRFGEVHPYELSSLIWGSTWFVLSDGLTAGQVSPDQVQSFLTEHGLAERGAALSNQAPAAVAAIAEELSTEPGRAEYGDASLFVVHADATRRFRSGIVG
jgi:Stage II sporulation protein E (SpoIIE)